MKTAGKAALLGIVGLLAFGLMLFLPAGTFHYWQGWLFLAVFALATWTFTVYLIRTNPAALERRMHAGRGGDPTGATDHQRRRLLIWSP